MNELINRLKRLFRQFGPGRQAPCQDRVRALPQRQTVNPGSVSNPHGSLGSQRNESGAVTQPTGNQGISPQVASRLAEGVAQIMAPRHTEHDHVVISSVTRDGRFPRGSEVWERQGNSMNVTRTSALVRTCSRAVVPVDGLRTVCSVCNGYDDADYRCAICAKPLCRLHAAILDTPQGPRILCPEHFNNAVRNWHVWDAMDAADGKRPKSRALPPGRRAPTVR